MKKFEIFKLDQHKSCYNYLILATSYESPLFLSDEVEAILDTDKAILLFDLTIINKFSSNRYIKCEYEKTIPISSCCSIVKAIPKEISDISFDFFTENPQYLDQPFVPTAFKTVFLDKQLR